MPFCNFFYGTTLEEANMWCEICCDRRRVTEGDCYYSLQQLWRTRCQEVSR